MQDNVLISEATKRNWERLGVDIIEQQSRLSQRANKRYSTKKIVPVEYFSNENTLEILEKIIAVSTDINSTIYTLAINLLLKNGLISLDNGLSSDNEYILEILENFPNANINQELLKIELPNERDFLGVVYQTLMSEGNKNLKGSYYTPISIIKNIIANLKQSDKFLDPCCGTGSFLLAACEKISNPTDICGCDLDEIACFIAKINLIIYFKPVKFRPNICNCNFLTSNSFDVQFDVIATNPPWGALTIDEYKSLFPDIKSDEIFSYFIIKSFALTKKGGEMIFVLPESILNVKAHQDIRKFILENLSIEQICLHKKAFSGVLTDVVSLKLRNNKDLNNQIEISAGKSLSLPQSYYLTNSYNKFSIMDNKDVDILNKIYSVPYITLEGNSVWGLGIVTGNNSKHISNSAKNMLNPKKIYSGKNIKKGEVSESNEYIDYLRERFQQVAPDEIYASSEKLVYKFISKKLVFAYDNEQRLFLNSANILIPNLPKYSIKNVMSFLNSVVFQYIYQKRFNELKILKNNLMELPFPINCNFDSEELSDDKIFEIFNLTKDEIIYIKKEVGVKNESASL